MSKKFVLTDTEVKRLTSDPKGGVENPVEVYAKEDAVSSSSRDDEKRPGITFPSRQSHLGPDRTIEC